MTTILIVDDDANMVSIMQRWIEPLGVDVRVAHGVDQAIEQMATQPHPELVLLDLVLPPHAARDTISAVSKLRKYNPALTVIIVSGMKREEILALVSEVKVEGILEKGNGFNQTGLLRAMQTAIAHSDNNSELLCAVGQKIADLTKKQTERLK